MSNNFEHFQQNTYGQPYLQYSYTPELCWPNYRQLPIISYPWSDFNLINQQITSFVPYMCPLIFHDVIKNCNENPKKSEQIVSIEK
jgi:hypothetical protein